ncbi:MAG TPA: 1-deoxy-D-xylulose-5-phosphate synthase, partial [Clostridia bacterium]|nr:1-deoxy-D-xylulose-5-phosphate synthase [Clostridia bacterium]
MSRLLDQLQLPDELRNLNLEQLDELAKEIRAELIDTVSKNGGHLAPNLGVVELTLALHSVFESPKDKIIWDVGHQSYVHKILTGRKDQFSTIRRLGGLSGFPKRSESIHDCFGTGHSSTSISAAVAFAKARDLKKEKYDVVAVIGDGSMTGGMAFEALNHAGHLRTDLIVILNDNEMSISPNVGALATHLSKLRTNPNYFKLKEDIENFLRKIPNIGEAMAKAAEKIKDSLKYLVVAGIIFEELGFTYLGPID